MGVAVLSQLGFDPLAMFLSISGVILAFAFSTSCLFGDVVIEYDAPRCSHFNLQCGISDWTSKFKILRGMFEKGFCIFS